MERRAGESNDMRRLVASLAAASVTGQVTNTMLFQALGAEDAAAKARVRRAVTHMVRRKELLRVRDGVFTYNPKAAPRRESTSYERVWRAVRASKPGFSVAELVQVTRFSERQVREYVRWLLEEGHLASHGQEGNRQLYRATQKARDTRETPLPPVGVKDPYEKERNAACKLVRLLMERDCGKPAVARGIVESCRAILARFEKEQNKEDEA